MHHSIDLPGGQWLSQEQAIEAMGVPVAMFDRLIKRGILSPGTGDNSRVKLWHWSEVYAVSQLWPRLIVILGGAPADEPEKEEPGKAKK